MPGEAEGTYVGSFDLIARIFAANTQPWARFNRVDMAIDCKQTGASGTLGLNGSTMRAYFSHARMVMMAAQREGSRVADCGVVAFLLHRPRGMSHDEQAHDAAYSEGLKVWNRFFCLRLRAM